MRIFLKILKWLFVALMALVIVMFAINWNDQPPSPEVLRMQSLLQDGPDVADAENAFVYAMGFAAPQGSDPVRAGAECIAKLNAAIHKQTINFDTDLKCWDNPSHKRNNAIISRILDTCTTADKVCVDALQENEQAIAQWLHDDGWLLQRYEGLLERSKWYLTIDLSPYMPFPHYDVMGDGRKMLLLKAWHLAGQGKGAEVQKLLDLDARFWRMLLSESNILLDKMIATAFLGKHFAFSNLVLRRLNAKNIPPVVPDSWLIPFAGYELSLQGMMAGEWAYFASALQEEKMRRTLLMDGEDFYANAERTTIDVWMDNLMGCFFLPQATQNEYAEVLLRLVEIFDVPVELFPAALQQADTYVKEFNLLNPYNPVGHVLVGVGMHAHSGYPARIYDLEGVRRAALLVIQLRNNGVDVNQVNAALDNLDLRNPYNNEPFQWNAETGSVVFKGLGPEDRNTHSFLY